MNKEIAIFGKAKKVVYRGAPSKENVKSKPQSSWATNAKLANIYAKERKGKLITAELSPKTGYFGNNYELAKALGIYDKYIKLRVADGDTVSLLRKAARRQGIDIQIITSTGEIVVFNPKIIKVISEKPITKKTDLPKTKPIRISPKMPRLK